MNAAIYEMKFVRTWLESIQGTRLHNGVNTFSLDISTNADKNWRDLDKTVRYLFPVTQLAYVIWKKWKAYLFSVYERRNSNCNLNDENRYNDHQKLQHILCTTYKPICVGYHIIK